MLALPHNKRLKSQREERAGFSDFAEKLSRMPFSMDGGPLCVNQ